MKQIFNFKLILILALLSLFVVKTNGQGNCNFTISTSVTPVDCRANGVITITLGGDDLAYMQDFLYRAYPSSANPNDYDFVTNHVISGLEEGTYVVEVKAFCTLSGVNISNLKTNVVVNRTIAYVEPDFSFNPSQFRKSLSCLATGTLYMQGITKGKGPYTIKLKSYPATYTGDTIIYQGTSLGTTYTIDNLSAGTYVVELSDGCGSAIQQTGVVENVSNPFPSNYINGYYYGSTLSSSDTNCSNMRFYASTSSSYETYYYARYGSQYYEYALFYTGDDVNNLEWKPMQNAYNSVYMEISTRYSISEMRATSSKIPKIYIRVKGGSDCGYATYSPTLYPISMTSYITSVECGVRRYTYTHYSNSVLCYPYTFTVKDVSTTDSTIVSISEPRYSTSAYDTLFVYPGDRYSVTLTDASGSTYTNTFIGTTAVNVSYISYSSQGCNLIYPYVYTSGSNGVATLAGATIEFLRDTTDARIPTPTHSNVTLPKIYTSYFYPYSTNYNQYQYLPSDSILPTGLTAYFRVTDSCGISKTIGVTGPPLKEYVTEPVFNITQSCGRAVIKVSNLTDILKNVNSLTGVTQSNLSAYAQITSRPSGADVIYSSTSSYLRPGYSDSVQVNKSGTYRFTFSNTTGFSGTSYCLKYVDVEIVIPEMAIDEATTAAYRCPGSSVGTGYMNVKVKNGSGNYFFTLYSKDNPTEVLATSTTGIFTSWTASTSDYYTVKIEDLTCGRSMTHDIFVYDLGNATLGWPEDNVFRKCLGDRIKLYALALGETTYSWVGPNNWSSSLKDPEIPTATLNNSGTYSVTVGVPGCGAGSTVTYSFNISVADKIMYWNPEAVDNNWYNTANWLTADALQANAVPAPCTTVHIGGNSNKYPNFDMGSTPRNQFGFPACDTIIYHYGSETVYPHYLKYNRARVQYNFNHYNTYELNAQPQNSKDMDEYPEAFWGSDMPTMKRAQWYLISSPLKHITGGDFGLGGYPNFYQRLYNATDPQRGYPSRDAYTLAFNTYNIDLKTTGHAMALWVSNYNPNYIGMGNHEHLEGLKGIIELPYFENAGIMSHRPLNQYRVADSTSTYQYYNASVPALTPIDRWDEYQRGYQSYRFAFENNRDTVDIYNVGGTNVSAYRLELPVAAENSSTRRVLIGNPLMCHIDFDKIYALNSGVIEDHYMITDGATQQFLNYRVNGVANELTKQIPPLQGFIITLVDSPSANYLLLPFEGSNAVITPSSDGSALPKPRQVGSETADVSTGWINISAITPPKTGLLQTTDSVVTRATLLINYDLNNIPKVVFPEGLTSKAEVYLIDNDGYLNTEQTENTEPEVVKFGLETGYKGNITFRFNKNNDVIDRVYLVDKALNVTKDISVGGDYIFQQRETSNGLDNDRFELRLTYKKSSIDTQTENTIIAYADHKKLVVQSNENIDKVTLHNSIGNTMFTASAINSTHFTQDLSLVPGVYVIIVELNNGFKQTQKLIIK